MDPFHEIVHFMNTCALSFLLGKMRVINDTIINDMMINYTIINDTVTNDTIINDNIINSLMILMIRLPIIL